MCFSTPLSCAGLRLSREWTWHGITGNWRATIAQIDSSYAQIFLINAGCSNQWIRSKSQKKRRNQDGGSTRSLWYIRITQVTNPLVDDVSFTPGAGALAAPLVSTQFAQADHWSFHYLCSFGLAFLNMVSLIAVFRFKRQEGSYNMFIIFLTRAFTHMLLQCAWYRSGRNQKSAETANRIANSNRYSVSKLFTSWHSSFWCMLALR